MAEFDPFRSDCHQPGSYISVNRLVSGWTPGSVQQITSVARGSSSGGITLERAAAFIASAESSEPQFCRRHIAFNYLQCAHNGTMPTAEDNLSPGSMSFRDTDAGYSSTREPKAPAQNKKTHPRGAQEVNRVLSIISK
jgi:hypothetical protein